VGLLLRLKLEAMPIVDIDNMGTVLFSLTSVGFEPRVLNRIESDFRKKRKYFKVYKSLIEISTYATEQEQWGNMMYGRFGWKRAGSCLVLYGGVRGFIRYATPPHGYACIIRTGPSIWQVTDPYEVQQDLDEFTELEEDDRTEENLRSQYDYFASSAEKYFHRTGCFYAEGICPEFLVVFDSRQDALDRGFEPCMRCKP